MKYFLLLLIQTQCIWALKDRVLFSLSDEYFYVNKVNTYLNVLSKAKCQDNLKYIYEISELSSEKLILPLTHTKELKDRINTNKVLTLFKIIVASRSEREKTSVGNLNTTCGNFSGTELQFLKDLVISNEYIKQRINTFTKDDETKSTTQVFIQSFLDPIESRIYY